MLSGYTDSAIDSSPQDETNDRHPDVSFAYSSMIELLNNTGAVGEYFPG